MLTMVLLLVHDWFQVIRLLGHSFSYASAGAATQDIGKPEYDIGGILDYNKEKYISNYFNFPQMQEGSRHWLQLNGAQFPQWQASVEDMLQISKQSVLAGKHQMKYGLRTMKENYCVFCIRLNLADSEYSRQISGLDTRGISLSAYYNLANAGGTVKPSM